MVYIQTTSRKLGTRVYEKLTLRRDWLRASVIGGAVLTDLFILFSASILAGFLRFGTFDAGRFDMTLLVVVPAYSLGCLAFGGYEWNVISTVRRSLFRSLFALGVAFSLTFAAAFAFQVGGQLSRLQTGYFLILSTVMLPFGRVLGAYGLRRFAKAVAPEAVVVGDGSIPHAVQSEARYFDVERRGWAPRVADPHFLHELSKTIGPAERVILAFADPDRRAEWTEVMQLTGLHTETVEPQFRTLRPIGIGDWEGDATMVVSRGPLTLGERALKRLFDVGLTLAVAPLAVAVVGILALAVKIESGGPALFIQPRVGRNNRHYNCYKLRTMRVRAADAEGRQSACRGDSRVTRLGRLMRRTSLDELPQLWNVFIGNMSLVGPRPHALGSTAEGELFWDAVQGYWSRHAMKPGLTGLAQVRGLRGPTLSKQDIEARVAADLEYINNWSLWLDLTIVVRTIAVLRHRNAY